MEDSSHLRDNLMKRPTKLAAFGLGASMGVVAEWCHLGNLLLSGHFGPDQADVPVG
jgi:hypothetical protein